MHAHDNGNEEARQLIAAMQMLRLATELSTPRKPAPKTDDGQPRPVPAVRVLRRQPAGSRCSAVAVLRVPPRDAADRFKLSPLAPRQSLQRARNDRPPKPDLRRPPRPPRTIGGFC